MVLAKFSTLNAIVSLLYPPVCAICSADVGPRKYLCDECETKLERIKPPFCSKCSEPFQGAITNSFDCANCAHRTLYFENAVSAFRSGGMVRRVILDFRYGRQIQLRYLVASWLFSGFADDRLRGRELDRMIPVAVHPSRKRG